jgi:hypothetical protein
VHWVLEEVPPVEAPAEEPEGLVPVVPPAVVPGAPPSVVGELLLVPPEEESALPALPLPAALPPALPAPALPELAPESAPAEPLAPPLPPALPPLPPPCAQVAVERPSRAAVMAAVSTFDFIMWNAL